MVNPLALLGVLPKLEGFAPLPIATMIPFMEAQSASLAYSFGLNYEFGKRKIKSMSNEEFNALTTEQIASMANAHTSVQMSHLQKVIPQSMGLQKEIMEMHKQIELEKVDMNISLMKELPGAYWEAITGTTQKMDESTRTEQETIGGRTPGGSRAGGDTNIDDKPEFGKGIIPPKPNTPTGGRSAGGSRTQSPVSKSNNEILSENNIKRQWQRVQSLQRQLEQVIKRPFFTHKQVMIDDLKNKINNELRVLNASQMSHKKNFEKFVALT